MVVNVLVARTGASVELWGAVGSRRLSPTVRTLPKTARRLPTPATVCHELPRTATFLRRVWRSASRGTWDLVTGHVAMLMAGLVLGRILVSKRAGIRSVASDPLLENEGEGTRSPVTVCHINFEGEPVRHRKKGRTLGRVLRRGRRSAPNRDLSTRQDCSVAIRRQFARGDRDAATVRRQGTTRFRGPNGGVCKVLWDWHSPSFYCGPSEDQCEEWLMSLGGPGGDRWRPCRRTDGIGVAGPKRSRRDDRKRQLESNCLFTQSCGGGCLSI